MCCGCVDPTVVLLPLPGFVTPFSQAVLVLSASPLQLPPARRPAFPHTARASLLKFKATSQTEKSRGKPERPVYRLYRCGFEIHVCTSLLVDEAAEEQMRVHAASRYTTAEPRTQIPELRTQLTSSHIGHQCFIVQPQSDREDKDISQLQHLVCKFTCLFVVYLYTAYRSLPLGCGEKQEDKQQKPFPRCRQ
ncbi:uncharacterized protein V6R79_025440 [Siganus canaliculatus]